MSCDFVSGRMSQLMPPPLSSRGISTSLQHFHVSCLSLCSQTPDKATKERVCFGSRFEGVLHRGGGRHSSKNVTMAAGHLASAVRKQEEVGGSCAVHFLRFTHPRTSAHSMMAI